MTLGDEWRIPRDAADWECGWEGARRFSLRYFRSLTLEEKLKAVESMGEVADFFQKKARARRSPKPDGD